MGTNYYRIPPAQEMSDRKARLMERISELDPTNPAALMHRFRDLSDESDPWESFMYCTIVHIGKASRGWKFSWDHNDWKLYRNPEEMLAFIRSGRIVDEYGRETPVEEFIEMATTKEGKTHPEYYQELVELGREPSDKEPFMDIVMDGFHYANYSPFS